MCTRAFCNLKKGWKCSNLLHHLGSVPQRQSLDSGSKHTQFLFKTPFQCALSIPEWFEMEEITKLLPFPWAGTSSTIPVSQGHFRGWGGHNEVSQLSWGCWGGYDAPGHIPWGWLRLCPAPERCPGGIPVQHSARTVLQLSALLAAKFTEQKHPACQNYINPAGFL